MVGLDPTARYVFWTEHGAGPAGESLPLLKGMDLETNQVLPFQQLGLVTAYAIGGALVAAVLVLPSMLILWDRWRRRNGDVPQALERDKEMATQS